MDDKATAAKIDPNTATAQECADWLAVDDGWTWRNYAGFEDERLWNHPDGRELLEYRHEERLESEQGPHPLTLDGAAGALQEPWRWDRVDWMTASVEATITQFVNLARSSHINTDGPDELTARYRAAVAARLAGMEGRG
jgi:hypothetical protein